MTRKSRELFVQRLETFSRAGVALLFGAVLLACWESGPLYAASEAETAAVSSRTAAAISELRGKIQGELDRIEAVEHRLETIEHPEDAKSEVMQLRAEIRSE